MPSDDVRAAGTKKGIELANARALALAPLLAEIQESGITGPAAIGRELTRRGIPTARGHKVWLSSHVLALLKRLDRLARPEPP